MHQLFKHGMKIKNPQFRKRWKSSLPMVDLTLLSQEEMLKVMLTMDWWLKVSEVAKDSYNLSLILAQE